MLHMHVKFQKYGWMVLILKTVKVSYKLEYDDELRWIVKTYDAKLSYRTKKEKFTCHIVTISNKIRMTLW